MTTETTPMSLNEQLIARMTSNPTKEKKGLGGMWQSSTRSISEVFDTVHTTTCTLHALARQGENHALQGETESSMELLALYGIEAEGLVAVQAAKELKKMLRGG